MTQNCKPSAILPFDQSADHSSVPAKFRTAVPPISGRGGHHGRLANPHVDARPIALISQSNNLFVRLARGIRSQ